MSPCRPQLVLVNPCQMTCSLSIGWKCKFWKILFESRSRFMCYCQEEQQAGSADLHRHSFIQQLVLSVYCVSGIAVSQSQTFALGAR